jgi:hypothetical protein
MTKSAIAVPGFNEGHVRTVNTDGSYKFFAFKNLREKGKHTI